jgi:murein L,D-transpeptidase YcbB/YkuD
VDSLNIQILNELLEKGGLKKALTNLEPRSTGYQSLKAGLKVLLDTLCSQQKESLMNGVTMDTLESHKIIKVIELNLDRWRKEKTDWGERYLFINIPSFMATLVSDGGVVLRSKVIVGKPSTPTPELSSEIQCFITYPYWHVTKKIASEEFLPFIKKDVSFLRKNNLDVLDRKGRVLDPDSIQWSRFSTEYFPVTLRQREGPENALGVLKFVFDNPYQVFLHDTNTPRLFQSKVRTFSHGCIRMEKARELAHYLLTGSTDARSPILDRYMQRKIRHTMNLEHPVSIYVRYITAEYNDHELFIYNDIYNKDRPLIRRLYGSSAR